MGPHESHGTKDEQLYKRRRGTIDYSKQRDLLEQLQMLKQKKAGLLMFLDTVKARLKESNL